MDAVMLYSTWPEPERAEACARTLIELRLIACANILPGAVAVFRWEGAIHRESECVMIVKTSAAKAGAARDTLISQHPYDTPCVTAVPLQASISNGDFIAWVLRETS